MGGSDLKNNMGKLLEAYGGDSEPLSSLDDKKVLEYALRQNWASAIKQIVASGPLISTALLKGKLLKQTTEATMAAFNLRQACNFRIRRMEEIENAGKTQVINSVNEQGEKKQTQVT
jgi:hypothetical protein